jgi:hypothetical protein
MCNREKKKEREEATRTAIWSHNRARLKKKLETYKTTARAKIAFRIEINSYCVYVCVCLCLPLSLWRSRNSRKNSNERQNTKTRSQPKQKKEHDQYYRNQFEVSPSLTLLKITKHSKLARSLALPDKTKSWKCDKKN